MSTHFANYNPNPKLRRVGDCTVRAISMVTGQSWNETYLGLCAKGFELKDMPSSNATWGAYLRDKGFVRRVIPDWLPEDYTVGDFCVDHAALRTIGIIRERIFVGNRREEYG